MINGGKSSNHTVDRIILESPLVQIYRNLHKTFEWNMLHSNVTNQHAEADMSQTFKQLCKYITAHSPHEQKLGRHSKYSVPDLLSKGQELLDKMEDTADVEGVEDQLEATLEDLLGE